MSDDVKDILEMVEAERDFAYDVIKKKNAAIEHLKNIICLADELLMDAWGCYHLRYDPNYELMEPIRAISGPDYHGRKERAARAMEKGPWS